jgi:nitroimidazol reductase NimA-like FMN-containing flavoprotein (pyridoxamine 5'-phosphate oxidase superfamily)
MSIDRSWQDLRALLSSQPLAVLGTAAATQPYASLVAYAINEELTTLLFSTTRATRKYRNLKANPQVTLLIDNRSNQESDFHEAMAATVLGSAAECLDEEVEALKSFFLLRHPHLADFLASPSCALLSVTIERYYLVRHFQQVLELTP